MAYQSWPNTPHNSRAVTLYEHEQLASAGLSDGLTGFGGAAAVFADSTGLQAKIPQGTTAWSRGTVFETTSLTTVTVGPNTSGSTRVDLLVLRLSRPSYVMDPFVIAGTPGAAAPLPVRDDNFDGSGNWDTPLAELTVLNGATSITAAQVKLRGWYLSPDGVILCTDTTRPPSFMGRTIRETNTGRVLESNGSLWSVRFEDTGWQAIPPGSGWSASGFCRARRHNGTTFLLLHFTRTGAALNAGDDSVMGGLTGTMGTLDGTAYRPDTGQNLFFTGKISGGSEVRGFIATNGAITIDDYQQAFNTGSVFTQSAPVAYPSTV